MSIEIEPFDRGLIRKSREVRKWFNRTSLIHVNQLRLGILPDLVYPETFLKYVHQPVELMLIVLMEGGWVNHFNWKAYARMLIASRLHKKKASIFRDEFEVMADPVIHYQLQGGLFKTQKKIQDFARKQLVLQNPDNYVQACSRLCLAVTDEVQTNAYVHPLHWIRAILATEDRQPAFGMAAYQVEMHYQKKTLCRLIRSPLPSELN